MAWKCFHCNEEFVTKESAALHFGPTAEHEPLCQIEPERFREMEEELRRYHEEDSELHRQIHKLHADHAIALQRAEESGYARALRDTNYVATE